MRNARNPRKVTSLEADKKQIDIFISETLNPHIADLKQN
jgi:hypothetical protein